MPLRPASYCCAFRRLRRIVRASTALWLAGFGAAFALADDNGPLRIAVAANFRSTMDRLIEAYQQQLDGQEIVVVSGSTGKLYAQILAGAPFHLFFAADDERPALLEDRGVIVPGSRFTYAIGALALWAPNDNFAQREPSAFLADLGNRRLAIANPELAPYGRAAIQTLEQLGLLDMLQDRIVRGENVAQAFHFARAGAASAAFVALSQVKEAEAEESRYWVVPPSFHSPIKQDGLALSDSDAALAFLAFCKSDRARSLIRARGYRLP